MSQTEKNSKYRQSSTGGGGTCREQQPEEPALVVTELKKKQRLNERRSGGVSAGDVMSVEREDEEIPTKGHDNHIVTIAITSTARLEREEKKIPTIGHASPPSQCLSGSQSPDPAPILSSKGHC